MRVELKDEAFIQHPAVVTIKIGGLDVLKSSWDSKAALAIYRAEDTNRELPPQPVTQINP